VARRHRLPPRAAGLSTFRLVAVAALLATLAACGGGSSDEHTSGARPTLNTVAPPRTPVTVAPTTVPPTTVPATVPTTVPVPTFAASTQPVIAADLGASWHEGCPVGPDQLRRVTLTYWGFDGQVHTGALVVHMDVTDAVIKAFSSLFAQHFPIRAMDPIDKYGGSDNASMEADNTSGFNCRLAVTTGPASWSVHAYGEAIDVNPVENPYLEGGQVLPPSGSDYLDRGNVRPGMAVAGGELVQAFADVGWQWGARAGGFSDYQHFSATGG